MIGLPGSGRNGDRLRTASVGRTLFGTLRTYFLAGIVVAAPIYITFHVLRWFVETLDTFFASMVPMEYRPETYLPWYVPGTGVVMAFLSLTVVGALTANFLGRSFLRMGERLIGRTPLVGTLYSTLKHIFHTAVSGGNSPFTKMALIEYPHEGTYAAAFVIKPADSRVSDAVGEPLTAVFLPTTPNPTSGFLLFVPQSKLRILDMSPEDGAGMVVSAGLSESRKD